MNGVIGVLGRSGHARRTTAVWASVAVAVGLAAGCGGSGPGAERSPEGTGSTPVVTPSRSQRPVVTPSEETTKPQPSPTALPGVALDASLRSTGSRLVAEYAVTNSSPRPVVVVDRIPTALGSSMLDAADIDPDHAWVVMAGTVVRVTKQAFPAAPGVRFIADPVIGGHVVAPGGVTKGTATAPLPPVLDVPGREFEAPRTPITQTADTWQFCVQVADLDQPREVVSVSAVTHAPLLCSDAEPLPAHIAYSTGQ